MWNHRQGGTESTCWPVYANEMRDLPTLRGLRLVAESASVPLMLGAIFSKGDLRVLLLVSSAAALLAARALLRRETRRRQWLQRLHGFSESHHEAWR